MTLMISDEHPRFLLTEYQHDLQGEPDPWGRFLRDFEIRHALAGFDPGHFANALELGCGSGKHSKCLAQYCRRLVALEYDAKKLTEKSDGRITFVEGDAQDLSRFSDGQFDLIFSSNLIEHLREIDRCMSECRRVVTDDGLIIHTVPNRTWKVFHLALYYPFMGKALLRRVLSKREATPRVDTCRGARPLFDDNLRPHRKRPLLRKLLPPEPHGISRSNRREFVNWGQRHWIAIFQRNGLEVIKTVRLPFYFGYGYNFRMLLRAGNRLRLSASTGYVMRKAQ
jgi:SAM-dependent methyltransferase